MSSKPTIHFSSRCDARDLATVASFFASNFDGSLSVSEIVREAIRCFAEILVVNNKVSFIPTQNEAIKTLESLGIMNHKNLIKRNFAEAVGRETMDIHNLHTNISYTSEFNPNILTEDNPILKRVEQSVAERLAKSTDILPGLLPENGEN